MAGKRDVLDVAALFSCLDSTRRMHNLSWREVAVELGVSPSLFTRLSQGHKPDVDTFLLLTDWMGIAPERLMDTRSTVEREQDTLRQEETLAAIEMYLRKDQRLKPENADAIARIVQAAYESFAEEEE